MEKPSTLFSAKFAQCGQGSGNFVWTKWYSVLASWSYWGLLNHSSLCTSKVVCYLLGNNDVYQCPIHWHRSLSLHDGREDRVWRATAITSRESKGMCLFLVKFYLITWLPDGDTFIPFYSPSQEWSSSWDDTAIRFGALLSNSELIIQFNISKCKVYVVCF